MGPLYIAGASIKPSIGKCVIWVLYLILSCHSRRIVSHLMSVCYFQIRKIRSLCRSLSFEAAHALVRALLHSRLAYCNAVLANAPQSLLAPLQSVLHSAARVVLRYPHRSGLMRLICERLHWLPVPERVTFKLSTLAYKCISGRAPDYLASMCTGVEWVVARARLRSATTDTVTVG